MKLRNLFWVSFGLFTLCDLCAMSPDDESRLLLSRGYSGDFSKIRRSIVQDYEHKLSSLRRSPENSRTMVRYLGEILDNVCYPVGLKKLFDENSDDWNALVRVISEDHRDEKSEFKGFYDALKLILRRANRGIELDFESLLDDQNDLDQIFRTFPQASLSGANVNPSENQPQNLVSLGTLNFFDPDYSEEPNLAAKKLLANILIQRLVVCLPTYAEVRFWEVKATPHGSAVHANFLNFEESLDKLLLEMRYKLRNGGIRGSSVTLEKWILDNFIKVYERLPIFRDIKRDPGTLLKESISDRGVNANALEQLGAVILGAQKTNATYRERKPFIITYGINPDTIRTYLTLGLGKIVHTVSLRNLQDRETDKNIVLGRAYSWKDRINSENASNLTVNKGWILDTLMKDGGVPFLDNILLIEDAERLLDSECVADQGSIGKELSEFITNLVSADCTSMKIPYLLGARISTEHLITIMVSGKEKVTPGVGTLNTEDLRPSLELRFPKSKLLVAVTETKSVRSDGEQSCVPPPVSPVNILVGTPSEEPVAQSISFDECKQIMENLLREQYEFSDEKKLKEKMSYSKFLERLLSGKSKIRNSDFDCSEVNPFIGKKENFLKDRSPESLALVKALIEGFVRKLVSDD